ncbi:hypothetical protein V5O48_019582, partial [Marasmius crinis-equi]
MIGYWKRWLDRADRDDFNTDYPAPKIDEARTAEGAEPGDLVLSIPNPGGSFLPPRSVAVRDLSDSGILDARILVSRKRTKNLFDYATLWKKELITKLDKHEATFESEPVVPLFEESDSADEMDIVGRSERPTE